MKTLKFLMATTKSAEVLIGTEETTKGLMVADENIGSSDGGSGSKEIVDDNRRHSENFVFDIESNGCFDGNIRVNKVFDGNRGNHQKESRISHVHR